MSSWIIIAIVVAVLVIIIAGMYNGLVALRNRFKNAFAQIDVQLKRRYDLIPNLVETAKGYMKHERETLEAVVKARNIAAAAGGKADAADPESVKALLGAESSLRQSMGQLMVVVERYPDLKADKTMTGLMEELISTENKVRRTDIADCYFRSQGYRVVGTEMSGLYDTSTAGYSQYASDFGKTFKGQFTIDC
jgi:LemA protein